MAHDWIGNQLATSYLKVRSKDEEEISKLHTVGRQSDLEQIVRARFIAFRLVSIVATFLIVNKKSQKMMKSETDFARIIESC